MSNSSSVRPSTARAVGMTECNIRDLVFLLRAVDAGDPSVETRCDAALSPVPGP
jgi:hypothetical protein